MGCTQSKSANPGNNQPKQSNPKKNSHLQPTPLHQHKITFATPQTLASPNDLAVQKGNLITKNQENAQKQGQSPNQATSQNLIKQTDSLAEQHEQKSIPQNQKSSLIQNSHQLNSNFQNPNQSKTNKKPSLPSDKQSHRSSSLKDPLQSSKHQNKLNNNPLTQPAHDKASNQQRNKHLDQSKQFENPNPNQSKIQEEYLAVESKVQPRLNQDHSLSQQRNNISSNHKITQKLNQTAHQPYRNSLNDSKQLNQSMTNSKKPFAHNLFYSQHPPQSKSNLPEKDKDEPKQSKTNQADKQNTKKNPILIDECFEEPEKPIIFVKSTKSELINQNNLNSSESLVQRVQDVKTSKNNMFVKKNQFYSVVEDKKNFNFRQEEFEEVHAPQIPSKKSIKYMNSSESLNVKKEKITTNECMIDQKDQQAAPRMPIESSYHAPSKRTIESSSSKKDILSSKAKIASNYLKSLEGKIVDRVDNSLEQTPKIIHQEHSPVKKVNEESHKKQSRVDTACFKQSSQKNLRSSQKENSHYKQELKQSQFKPQYQNFMRNSEKYETISQTETLVKESTLPKKKVGPIMFSEISFREKSRVVEDSMIVPDEQNISNGLHISIHLNLSHGL